MFLTLPLVTLIVAAAVAAIVVWAFTLPLERILMRMIADEISFAWLKYMKFAILVVGISAGVRVHELEKYVTPALGVIDMQAVALTRERWVLEIYRTVIDSLQGIAWMLLVFFSFALVAFVILRMAELKRSDELDARPTTKVIPVTLPELDSQ